MSQSAVSTWHPRVFVGATTGSLNPQIPSPVWRSSPVAIEIADGIGFAIDGESLVVTDGVREGATTITGRLEDGTYPQRDFTVTRQGQDTRVEGYYDWQDYSMRREGSTLNIAGETPRESSVITEQPNGDILVEGAYPAQRYEIRAEGNTTRVTGYDEFDSALITFAGDKITIQGAIPERTFEITKTENGFHVQGAYRFQDFDVTLAPEGFTIQGLYPQQKYVVANAGSAA